MLRRDFLKSLAGAVACAVTLTLPAKWRAKPESEWEDISHLNRITIVCQQKFGGMYEFSHDGKEVQQSHLFGEGIFSLQVLTKYGRATGCARTPDVYVAIAT